jgi:AcrR family transcriptional regulator
MDATTQTLRQRRKEELRERILVAARALFAQVGYDAFSMRKLADEVGCSAGNLYLYFESQEHLFRCLVDEGFAELERELRAALSSHRDPVAQLKRGMRAYVDFGVRHPDAYRIAFLVRRPRQQGAIEPHAAFETLRIAVRACVAARRFRKIDVDLASQALWTALHGVTSLLVQLPQFPWVDTEQLVATVIDHAVQPLLPPKGRS